MQVIAQTLGEILDSLRPLIVAWQDEVSARVIDRLQALPVRETYGEEDIRQILETGSFDDGLLIVRLFLGLSKDQFTAALIDALGPGGSGVTRYKSDRTNYLNTLTGLGLLEAMAAEMARPLHWSDTLVERLRSGRGSAISGQRRGRGVEDFAEQVVRQVFGNDFQMRVTFAGRAGRTAKCDFAIPSREMPRILIEAKGYAATGSKMTDVIGDIEQIIASKRGDTTFLFFTDGLTWKQRQSDLRKIVRYQNNGDIARVYTYSMATQFEADLRQLKQEYAL
jgi:hypothetical protein